MLFILMYFIYECKYYLCVRKHKQTNVREHASLVQESLFNYFSLKWIQLDLVLLWWKPTSTKKLTNTAKHVIDTFSYPYGMKAVSGIFLWVFPCVTNLRLYYTSSCVTSMGSMTAPPPHTTPAWWGGKL